MGARNSGSAVGRLAADPRAWANRDGSKTVRLTLFARRNYASKQDSDRIDLEAYVPEGATGLGVFSRMGQGDLVGITYEVRSSSWLDRNGEVQYRQALHVREVELLESRQVTAARRASKARHPAGRARLQAVA